MTRSTGRRQGGEDAARPDAIDAAERLIDRTLPLFLPLTPRELRQCQAAGISRERHWQAIERLALTGRVEFLFVNGQMVVASTCADRPIECVVAPEHLAGRTTTTTTAGATPAAEEEP